MFHWRDGWFFRRFENGDVEIKRIPLEKQGLGFGEGEADFGITIPAEEWCSIVHAMLPPGTPSEAYYGIRAMHEFPQQVPEGSVTGTGPMVF